MGKKKSVRVNAALNMLNTFLSMMFSLITYPYVSRVLGAENLGKVSYAASIVSYFALIAALGYQTYAVREGSRRREDPAALKQFCNGIFSMNAVSVAVACVLLLLLSACMDSFRTEPLLLVIHSLVIFTNWLCVEWINIIQEDYVSVTVRHLGTQMLSLALLFTMVRTQQDYYLYAAISVFSNFAAAVLNLFYVRKRYCAFSITLKCGFSRHIKPVLIFFSNTVAVSIYANSDITMIGYFLGDRWVGLYSVAVKIYTVIRRLIAAAYTAAVPRMAFYAAQDKMEDFKNTLNRILYIIIFASVFGMTLLCGLSTEIIVFLSGNEYQAADRALSILAFAFFFAVLGGCLAYCVATPLRRERIVLLATAVAAVENILLNMIVIPGFGIRGAAFSTALAEFTVCAVLTVGLRDYWSEIRWRALGTVFVKCLAATLPMWAVRAVLWQQIDQEKHLIRIVSYSVVFFLIYCGIGLMIKNDVIYTLLDEIRQKFDIFRKKSKM